MKLSDIIKQVRYSIDEEVGQSDLESTYMDHIISSKVYDALKWVSLYADASLLNGSDGSSDASNIIQITVYPDSEGYVEMPSNFMRMIRVRGENWHRAVMKTIAEDSDEYLMQYDEGIAKADKSRPVVALIETSPNKIQLFPPSNSAELTYAKVPDEKSTLYNETEISIPPKVKSAFIYYIAYLVMIAYDDSRAASMLATAKMNAGIKS